MVKFVPRFKAPDHDDKNYYSDENIYHANGLGMYHWKKEGYGYYGNCTAYVYGRLLELTGKKFEGFKGNGNAEDFYELGKNMGLEVGQTPKLGAIICWREGKTGCGADGYGHVAIVEEIRDNGDIITSQSGWNSYEFLLRTITKASGYTYMASKPLVGFIYCGVDFYAEKETESGEEVKYERVQVGSYMIKANAVRRANEIKSKGYPAIIKKHGMHYRVQVGAYQVHSNAVNMLNRMKSLGYKDAYITTEGGTDVSF